MHATRPLNPPASAPLAMAPLVLAALTGTMAMMAFVAVVGPLVRRLDLPEWVAGLSVTAGGVLWLLLARWWGGVGDRRGRKPVLLVGLGAFALVYAVLALGMDLALRQHLGIGAALVLLVAARALIGAFYAAVPPTVVALIADHTAPGARRPPGGQPMRLFDPRLRVATLTGFAAMGSVSIAQVLVGFFAIDRLGLPVAEGARVAGLALACVGGSLMLSQQLVMRLKAVPLARWLVLGALIAGCGFAAVAAVRSQAMLLGCYAVMAFGMGLVFPNFQAMAANAVQAHEQGAAAGTLSAAQGLGVVLGPIVGTVLYRVAHPLPYLLVGAGLWALAAFIHLRWRCVRKAS